MPLIQFIGSFIAVTIVALIASRLFKNNGTLTVERVVRNTARFCPHIDLSSESPCVFISETGDSAVLVFPNKEDGFALLTALGDRVVVREITDVRDMKLSETKTGLSFEMNDFTQPKIQLNLPEPERKSLLVAIKIPPIEPTESAHA